MTEGRETANTNKRRDSFKMDREWLGSVMVTKTHKVYTARNHSYRDIRTNTIPKE